MRLLLAEDTQALNRAVTVLLEQSGYDVDSVFDGEAAMERILSSGYDGIILDIMMPKKDGLQVLSELRARHVLTPVLLLTAKAEVDDRVAGLDAGADDYLPKPFAMKELLARVRSMTRRHSVFDSAPRQFGDIILDTEQLSLTAFNSIRLSAQECELLQLLMANTDTDLNTEVIISDIWKNEPDATADTVWLYISYLRGKLRSIGSSVTIVGDRGGSYRITCERS